MKLKRTLDYIATSLICGWALLQFVSCEPNITLQKEKDLPAILSKTWQELKSKNLINGTILIQQGNKILFTDGPLNKPYAISSMSKSFVGWKYLQLQREGLKLNTPICHWLTNFCQNKLKNITLEMLLEHRSGFGKDLSVAFFLERTFDSQWSIKAIDNIPIKPAHLENEPGSTFMYSNFGYLVLSRVLEIIENQDFDQIIKTFTSLIGLKNTSSIKRHEILPVSILVPYSSFSIPLELETILYRSAGTGGLQASATDLSSWISYVVGNGLGAELTMKTSKPPKKPKYKFGWVHAENSEYESYWHNGASLGAYSLMAFLPKSNVRIIILTDNLKLTKQWTQFAEQFEQYFY